MSRKIFRGWGVVAVAAIGIGFSSTMFLAGGYTILAAGMAPNFGWGLTEMATGATLFLVAQAIGYPMVGYFIDRWGTLRVAQAGLLIFGGQLLVFSRITELWQFFTLMFTMGLLGIATYSVPYFRAISLWFRKKRGTALGFAASGVALGGIVFPLALQKIIAKSGWADAVLAVAALELLVCLPLVTWLVRDNPAMVGERADGGTDENDAGVPESEARLEHPSDMRLAEVVRTIDFWLLGSIFLVAGIGTYAVLTNSVHILSKGASLTTEQVAVVQATGGLATFIGRILGGMLLDRINPRAIGFMAGVLLASGWAGFALTTQYSVLLVAAALSGLAMGGELDVLPYLTAKLFGLTHFGKNYGVLAGIYGAGGALGPLSYAVLVSLTESPTVPVAILAAATAVMSAFFFLIGRRRAE